jgi:hypothetical protein
LLTVERLWLYLIAKEYSIVIGCNGSIHKESNNSAVKIFVKEEKSKSDFLLGGIRRGWSWKNSYCLVHEKRDSVGSIREIRSLYLTKEILRIFDVGPN